MWRRLLYLVLQAWLQVPYLHVYSMAYGTAVVESVLPYKGLCVDG